MARRASLCLALAPILLSVPQARALAQWQVAIEVGADRFWGGSEDSTAERRSFRPYRPTTFGAILEREFGRVGVGMRLGYTEASLGLEGASAVVAVKGVFEVFSISPELNYQLTTLGADNRLRLH